MLVQSQVKTNVASPITMPVGQMSDEQRAALAKEWGYTKIGKELPDNVTLTDIIKSMPAEVLRLTSLSAGMYPIHTS